jgi:hypothetical protein
MRSVNIFAQLQTFLPTALTQLCDSGSLQSRPFTPVPLYRAKVSDVISHTIAALGFWRCIGGGLGLDHRGYGALLSAGRASTFLQQ